MKKVYLVPNIVTTGNMFCGFYSMIAAMNSDYVVAAWAIVAASVFDMLDGRIARLAKATSQFGVEYDSLSDLISFGMAPSVLIYRWALQPFERLGWLAAFLFVCGALRLARFNVMTTTLSKKYFQGLPIPMAAGVVATFIIFNQTVGWPESGSVRDILVLFLTFGLSSLMVSTIKFPSFKELNWGSRASFGFLLIGVLSMILIAVKPEVTLFALLAAYVLASLGWNLVLLTRRDSFAEHERSIPRMARKLKIAVVGATGAVGKELLSTLEARSFPISELLLFSSPRSEGRSIPFAGRSFTVRTLSKGCFEGADIAFFDASDAVSKEWVPEAAASGAWVVDNSATFRLKEGVPLLVPEVNGAILTERLARARHAGATIEPFQRILSGPNCSTAQLVLPLHAIGERWGLERVLISTYQSTSGAGSAAMEELSSQARGFLSQQSVPPRAFAHEIAFNCIPHIGGFVSGSPEDGYTSEEQKIMLESRKILALPSLRISATAVRVPTFSCHGESVAVECQKPFEIPEIRAALREQAGIVVQDDPARKIYPMGRPGRGSIVEGATGRDAVYVGRIRKDHSVQQGSHGLHFWVVSDNLRKGAALNAIQIGEILVRHWF